MEITKELKKRFCKDCNLPIKLYDEPYFSDRLQLFETRYNAASKYEVFKKELERFKSEQEYFEYYNSVKDKAISSIKQTEAYMGFNLYKMDRFAVNTSIPNKSIFKETLVNKRLVSIDLAKGCFAAMKYFNKAMVNNCRNYEEFIGQFTDMEHIKNSKYIRQVIFGNCNPRRQTTIEKYLVGTLLNLLLNKGLDESRVVAFMDDEIVIDVDGLSDQVIRDIKTSVEATQTVYNIDFHFEVFTIKKIANTPVYLKIIEGGGVKVKGADSVWATLIERKLINQEITESDLVFETNGLLAKFITIPRIELP